MKVCSIPGCPNLHRNVNGKCPAHSAEHERRRGTRQQRGYNTAHDRLRAEWAPQVATGLTRCWRCGERITAGEPWDLGHDDNDRTRYRGPEHANRCNRSAAGRRSHNQ